MAIRINAPVKLQVKILSIPGLTLELFFRRPKWDEILTMRRMAEEQRIVSAVTANALPDDRKEMKDGTILQSLSKGRQEFNARISSDAENFLIGFKDRDDKGEVIFEDDNGSPVLSGSSDWKNHLLPIVKPHLADCWRELLVTCAPDETEVKIAEILQKNSVTG